MKKFGGGGHAHATLCLSEQTLSSTSEATSDDFDSYVDPSWWSDSESDQLPNMEQSAHDVSFWRKTIEEEGRKRQRREAQENLERMLSSSSVLRKPSGLVISSFIKPSSSSDNSTNKKLQQKGYPLGKAPSTRHKRIKGKSSLSSPEKQWRKSLQLSHRSQLGLGGKNKDSNRSSEASVTRENAMTKGGDNSNKKFRRKSQKLLLRSTSSKDSRSLLHPSKNPSAPSTRVQHHPRRHGHQGFIGGGGVVPGTARGKETKGAKGGKYSSKSDRLARGRMEHELANSLLNISKETGQKEHNKNNGKETPPKGKRKGLKRALSTGQMKYKQKDNHVVLPPEQLWETTAAVTTTRRVDPLSTTTTTTSAPDDGDGTGRTSGSPSASFGPNTSTCPDVVVTAAAPPPLHRPTEASSSPPPSATLVSVKSQSFSTSTKKNTGASDVCVHIAAGPLSTVKDANLISPKKNKAVAKQKKTTTIMTTAIITDKKHQQKKKKKKKKTKGKKEPSLRTKSGGIIRSNSGDFSKSAVRTKPTSVSSKGPSKQKQKTKNSEMRKGKTTCGSTPEKKPKDNSNRNIITPTKRRGSISAPEEGNVPLDRDIMEF